MVKEDLQMEFESLGMNVSDDVLDRCEAICISSNIPPEEFVETWMAYTLSNLNGADPTLEYITQFERKELKSSVITEPKQSAGPKNVSAAVIYKASSTTNSFKVDNSSIDMIDVYAKTPKGKTSQKRGADSTPDGNLDKKNGSIQNSPSIYTPASFRPDLFSPISTHYSKRTNSGQVVVSYGETANELKWKTCNSSLTVNIVYGQQIVYKTLFMFETLLDKQFVLDSTVSHLGEAILKKHSLPKHENHCKKSQSEIIAYGRICCEATDGILKDSSIFLEGNEEICRGLSIKLELPEKNVSIFPGQIVAVKGSNPKGNAFVANEIFTDAALQIVDQLPSLDENTGPMKIFVSAGPFTLSDTLFYKPLEDLIALTAKEEPHVLILIGPLLDTNHPSLQGSSLAETFEDFYVKLIDSIVQPLEMVRTRVVLVASYKEATSPSRYPTPSPFCITHLKQNKIEFVTDPSTLNINGVVIGVTSVDVLRHLSREEYSATPEMKDRIPRLANHLIQQQSYYPLMPPSKELSIDMDAWELYAQMPVTPHILILPSDLRYLIKNLSGCLVINPERLSKGTAGGSLAKIEIKPVSNKMNWSTSSHINAQIVKI